MAIGQVNMLIDWRTEPNTPTYYYIEKDDTKPLGWIGSTQMQN